MITIFSQSLFGFPCFLQPPSRESSRKGQASYTMMISCDSCTFMACRESMTPQQGDSYIPRAAQ